LKASQITAIEFFNDLSSPYARKRFFWGFVLFAGICVLLLYAIETLSLSGPLHDIATAVVVDVLAGVLIILAFYGLYHHFIGPNRGLSEVSVTRPQDITARIKELPSGTKYMFWGRSGSYFRAYPLRELDRQARDRKLVTDVEVVLPDPTDDRLVKSYNDILVSLGEKANGNALLANVLATSISCAVTMANNKYLRVRLFYSKFLPAFRVDLSEGGAILTQDDPSKSALFFESGSEFYEMLRTTIRNEMNVSREVVWENGLFVGRVLDEAACDESTLEAFGLPIDDVDQMQQKVASLIAERQHRYR